MLPAVLGLPLAQKIARLYQESIQYGLAHRDTVTEYARTHAVSGLSDRALADQYIDQYVNDHSIAEDSQLREGLEYLLGDAIVRKDFFLPLAPAAKKSDNQGRLVKDWERRWKALDL